VKVIHQCYKHPTTHCNVTRHNIIYNHKHELHNQKSFIYQLMHNRVALKEY